MECQECGKEFTKKKCPSCGWQMPKESTEAEPSKGKCWHCGASPNRRGRCEHCNIQVQVVCCHCRHFLTPEGWCEACNLWPINITPKRTCPECGQRKVLADGECDQCRKYVASVLIEGGWDGQESVRRLKDECPDWLARCRLTPGEWLDTRHVATRLPEQENRRRLRAMIDQLSTDLSMDRVGTFAVREDYAPDWLKRTGHVVGKTPMGYDIIGPMSGKRAVADMPHCFEFHVQRFQGAGLSHAAAQMQAFALVKEAEHAERCKYEVPF